MNLKDRIEIELQRQDNELLREALAYVDAITELEALHNTLDAHDLPTDSEALSAALERAKADYMALAERYDKLSDIADKYAELSDKLAYLPPTVFK